MKGNSRRFERTPHSVEIQISWEDAYGQTKYSRAQCLDISASGMSLELVESVRPRSRVTLKSDGLRLAGSATVRYCVRRGGKFTLGLEFMGGLKLAVRKGGEAAAS
jgi:hypothetical protein